MKRKTKFQVYVSSEVMENPLELFDAAFAHLIKNRYSPARRKQFMAQFMKENDPKRKIAVVNEWIMVKDIKNFPFRQGNEELPEDITDEDTGVDGDVSVDDGADGSEDDGDGDTASDGRDT